MKKKGQGATKEGLQKIPSSLNKYPTTQQNPLVIEPSPIYIFLPIREDY